MLFCEVTALRAALLVVTDDVGDSAATGGRAPQLKQSEGGGRGQRKLSSRRRPPRRAIGRAAGDVRPERGIDWRLAGCQVGRPLLVIFRRRGPGRPRWSGVRPSARPR